MEANDGQEALDLATQSSDPIQLLITDIVMPKDEWAAVDGAAIP